MDYQRIFKAVLYFKRKGDLVKASALLCHAHANLLKETSEYLRVQFKIESKGFCSVCGEEKDLDEQGQCQFCFNQKNNQGRGYYGPSDADSSKFDSWLNQLESDE